MGNGRIIDAEMKARIILLSHNNYLSLGQRDFTWKTRCANGEEAEKPVRRIDLLRWGSNEHLYVVFAAGYDELDNREDREKVYEFIAENFALPAVCGFEGVTLQEARMLMECNQVFIHAHGEIDAFDMNVIRDRQNAISAVRSDSKVIRPMPGDIVEGSYYGGAHAFKGGVIVTRAGWGKPISICAHPYTPWVTVSEDGTPLVDTSGGPFFSVGEEDLEYIGEDHRYFCDWGHAGATGDGSIEFPAMVRRWRVRPSAKL